MVDRESKKQQTVDRILKAATEVFAAAGFEGARVDAIARRAGVNKAMIYYHIGDKSALYSRVLHAVFGDTAARLADHLTRADTLSEKLRAYVQNISATLAKNPLLPPILLREVASGAENLPEVVAADMAAIISMLGEMIRDGQAQGLAGDVDPLILHLMVVGGFNFYYTSGSVRRRFAHLATLPADRVVGEDIEPLAREVEKIVLSAVLVAGPGHLTPANLETIPNGKRTRP